jgi:hypothetical protein
MLVEDSYSSRSSSHGSIWRSLVVQCSPLVAIGMLL